MKNSVISGEAGESFKSKDGPAMDLYEEMVALIDALAEANVDYALCGGIAVAFHGYPRFTKDIDILIRPEDLDAVLSVAKKQNYSLAAGKLRFGAGTPNEREIYRISKVEGEEILTLDLVLVFSALEDVWKERELFELHGRRIQVVSLDGLSKMKRLSGRDQDLLDLKMLGLEQEE